MNWFEKLTGFREVSPDQVRGNLIVAGSGLTSKVNQKKYTCGTLETPSLRELRERVAAFGPRKGQISVREVVADVQQLHRDASNAGALFQVASQFNLLEMASPHHTPEQGVGIYENDPTQGPACAIAAGAGTIYRNYFAQVNSEVGQSATNQIDCLADIGDSLGNNDGRLWEMRNGYAMATDDGWTEISKRLTSSDEDQIDALRTQLRIGVQSNTQVTLGNSEHLVSQAYCSALPVAYYRHAPEKWEQFARLVLEASYEATLCAAILNGAESGNDRVFLTLLGGGVFGNKTEWITQAIARALSLHRHADLDVAIVGFSFSKQEVRDLIDQKALYSG